MLAAAGFGVKSIPTILVLRGGKEVARLDGLITGRDLTAAFDREAAGATPKRKPLTFP
jgi:thioredoxin-like negative regulator of GroEL